MWAFCNRLLLSFSGKDEQTDEISLAAYSVTRFYDARGNLYGVASPDYLRRRGIDLPDSAHLAARERHAWTALAIAAECGWGTVLPSSGAKAHRCDGLLVGPFQAAPPFDVLIVNTDGSLAERSGNGLTIFAQALTDQGLMYEGCELRVHHDKRMQPHRWLLRWSLRFTNRSEAFGWPWGSRFSAHRQSVPKGWRSRMGSATWPRCRR
jgi:hypothetical protein